ncbi:MAG: DNA-binding protein [Lachnospiraceae bacterium]|uniref:UPF0122 protein FRC54_01050 n=1 Tax=Candidatus Weimeria bifida TaxID=2599074 RepID=A0A6N7IXY9_9FIRM|nr:DNA-binding protein [Candidatus Weimeria bifida]RRF96117.1 MAG: DNA-binding protein [Lachnospiraceae bacterium]
MEEKVHDGLLFDFYGELLTDKQKKIFREYAFEDLSLSEMAGEFSMSRQGISEMIHRVSGLLRGYEEKLGLLAEYQRIEGLAKEIAESDDIGVCHRKAEEIMKQL